MITALTRRALYGLATNPQVESVVRSNRMTEDAAYRAASRYVAGRTLDEAIPTVRRLTRDGFAVSLDLFGEGNDDESGVARVVDGYRAAAAAIADVDGDVYLEIVPSHLGLDLGVDVCRRYVEQLVELLPVGRGWRSAPRRAGELRRSWT